MTRIACQSIPDKPDPLTFPWPAGGVARHFFETPRIRRAGFAAACQSGQRQYDELANSRGDRRRLHRLPDLPARDVWPTG
jgi:hypothetical protein